MDSLFSLFSTPGYEYPVIYYSPVDKCLVLFLVFDIMNKAVMKKVSYKSSGDMFSFPLGKYLGVKLMEMYNFVRKCQMVFQTGCTILCNYL